MKDPDSFMSTHMPTICEKSRMIVSSTGRSITPKPTRHGNMSMDSYSLGNFFKVNKAWEDKKFDKTSRIAQRLEKEFK